MTRSPGTVIFRSRHRRSGCWTLADRATRCRQRERAGKEREECQPLAIPAQHGPDAESRVPPQYAACLALSTLDGHFVSQQGMLTSTQNLTRGNTQGFPWELSALWLLHNASGVAVWLAWPSHVPRPPAGPSRDAPSCCRSLRLYTHFYYCYKTKRNEENPTLTLKYFKSQI